jgi:branched-chain amino acid transport system substrate-binding protein
MMRAIKNFSLMVLIGFFTLGFACTGAIAAEVVIGFSGPLSGPAAQYGRDCLAGVELAIKDLNRAGGIKIGDTVHTFKVVSYDDMIDPTAAVNNSRRLVSRDRAVAIFNPVFNTLAAMMQINEQRGSEFLLMAYTSTPALDQTTNKLTVGIPPPFSAYAIAFADRAWEKGWRKGAMVVTLGAYGDEWRKEFRRVWTEKGGEITADQPANYYTETDFSSHLAAALATKPDFLLVGGPSDPTGLVIEQARNLGFMGGFMMVDQAKMNYIVEVTFKGDITKMNNVWGVVRTLDLGVHSETQQLIDRFAKEQDIKVATSENFLNYSAMRILAAAMEKAGTVTDKAKIKAAIHDVLPLPVEDNPIMYVGLQESRLLVQASIQFIEDNQYQTPIQSFWWIDDERELQRLVEMQPAEHKVHRRMLPLEGYVK